MNIITISKTKYKIEDDFKETVNMFIESLTTLDICEYSPFINEVLIETILPRIVADVIYSYISPTDTPIHVSVKYNSKSYTIRMVSKTKELGGIVYNVID